MAMMLGALYKALLSGGVSEDQATKAAEEVAAYDMRLARVEADLKVLTWMVGTNIGLTLLVLGKLFLR